MIAVKATVGRAEARRKYKVCFMESNIEALFHYRTATFTDGTNRSLL